MKEKGVSKARICGVLGQPVIRALRKEVEAGEWGAAGLLIYIGERRKREREEMLRSGGKWAGHFFNYFCSALCKGFMHVRRVCFHGATAHPLTFRKMKKQVFV